jgi:hypothetical protein
VSIASWKSRAFIKSPIVTFVLMPLHYFTQVILGKSRTGLPLRTKPRYPALSTSIGNTAISGSCHLDFNPWVAAWLHQNFLEILYIHNAI